MTIRRGGIPHLRCETGEENLSRRHDTSTSAMQKILSTGCGGVFDPPVPAIVGERKSRFLYREAISMRVALIAKWRGF
jgi:hypothetical protein